MSLPIMIYNKCGICHQDLNKYFCQKFSKNLCENCFKKLCDKYKKIHDLINLDEEEKRPDKYINLINEIIQKVKKYIKVREKQKDNENFINNNKSEIKDAQDYSLEFNKDKIKKERTKYEELFNNDFEIADIILAKKFKNQFFFIDIERLFEYFNNEYKDIYDKESCRIEINKKEGEEGIHEEFFPKFNKDIEKNYLLYMKIKEINLQIKLKVKKNNLRFLVYQNETNNNPISLYIWLPLLIKNKLADRINLKSVPNRKMIDFSLFNLYGVFPELFKKTGIKDENGVKVGEGKAYYAGKTIIYEGNLKDGKRHGKGKLYDTKNKVKYDGEWANDKAEGKGKLTLEEDDSSEVKGKNEYSYNGDWKNNAAEGKGIITLFGKKYYEGDFVKEKWKDLEQSLLIILMAHMTNSFIMQIILKIVFGMEKE